MDVAGALRASMGRSIAMNRIRSRRVSGVLVLAGTSFVIAIGAARTAAAEPSCAPPAVGSSAVDEKAEALYRKGIEARSAAEWEAARTFFLQACQISSHYQILAHLGEAELKLGLYRDAAEHLSAFLAAAPSTMSAVSRAKGEEMLAEARSHVGTVSLAIQLPNAVVLVDGAPVGRVPLKGSLFVEPGLREFEARGEGGAKAKTLHSIAPGSEVTIQLEPKVPEGPRIELVPAQPPGPVPPPSFTASSRELDVMMEPPGSSERWRGPLMTTLLAASGAASAVAIGNVVAMFSVANPNDNATQKIFGNVAFWHVVGAGVAGAGALSLWATRPSGGTGGASSPKVAVVVGGPGIRLEGRW